LSAAGEELLHQFQKIRTTYRFKQESPSFCFVRKLAQLVETLEQGVYCIGKVI
jgi:hypothetical protein